MARKVSGTSRHKHRAIGGESATVDPAIVDDWKTRLPLIIDKYAPENVYNADETGLFFKALPDRSLVMAKETCKGGKRSKKTFPSPSTYKCDRDRQASATYYW
jgi:hypothetical protein